MGSWQTRRCNKKSVCAAEKMIVTLHSWRLLYAHVLAQGGLWQKTQCREKVLGGEQTPNIPLSILEAPSSISRGTF
jgi:hypothetical protein